MRHVPASQPQTMVGFLKSIGGLRDCAELRARDARLTWPGLVNNKRGLSLDTARRACAESGYCGADIDARMGDTDINDFLRALDDHPHYRETDGDRLWQWRGGAAHVAEPFVDSLSAILEALEAYAVETGYGDPSDKAWLAMAAQVMLEDPTVNEEIALDRAAILLENERSSHIEPDEDTYLSEKASPARVVRSVFPHLEALAWRKRMKLSRDALAAKSGFSRSQIIDYEAGGRRGKSASDAAISDAAWARYAMACAAIEAGLTSPF